VRKASEPAIIRTTATRATLQAAVYASCPKISRAEARDIFQIALEEISETLVRGECVNLRSFGLFAVRVKQERVGRNPRTGVEAPIKSRRVATFRPSPALTACINGAAADKKVGDIAPLSPTSARQNSSVAAGEQDQLQQ
jgi:integration host factor subunit alpha